MLKKGGVRIIITIIIAILVIGGVSYFIFSDSENLKIPSNLGKYCEDLKVLKSTCFAIVNDDISQCDNYYIEGSYLGEFYESDEVYSSQCEEEVAISTGDASLCEGKEGCVRYSVFYSEDKDQCELMESTTGGNYKICVDLPFMEKGDISYCEGDDVCIRYLAKYKLDESLCEEIQDEKIMGACYYSLSLLKGDKDLCEEHFSGEICSLLFNGDKDDCYDKETLKMYQNEEYRSYSNMKRYCIGDMAIAQRKSDWCMESDVESLKGECLETVLHLTNDINDLRDKCSEISKDLESQSTSGQYLPFSSYCTWGEVGFVVSVAIEKKDPNICKKMYPPYSEELDLDIEVNAMTQEECIIHAIRGIKNSKNDNKMDWYYSFFK